MKKGVDLSGTAFCEVDRTGYSADFITYLDQAADYLKPVKIYSHSLLQLRPGERILDIGCGCGDDLRALAPLVIPNGCAMGIDSSQAMINEACRRNSRCELPLHFEVGDAGHLRWQAEYFDACRADRVFQHLPDPERTLNEMLRVLKPSGRILVVDRDWDMVILNASDVETTRIVLNRASAGIRNGRIGTGLRRLFHRAGVVNIKVEAKSVHIKSFAIADTLLDLRTVLDHAIAEKRVGTEVADQWLNELLGRDTAGQFHAMMTLFISWGRKQSAGA